MGERKKSNVEQRGKHESLELCQSVKHCVQLLIQYLVALQIKTFTSRFCKYNSFLLLQYFKGSITIVFRSSFSIFNSKTYNVLRGTVFIFDCFGYWDENLLFILAVHATFQTIVTITIFQCIQLLKIRKMFFCLSIQQYQIA